jgi:hypothetical protein
MSGPSLGPHLGPHAQRLTPADEKAARAALGIEDEATIIPMDLSRSPLFVIVMEKGDGGLEVIARATLTKRAAAGLLREVAEQWERAADEAGEPHA